MCLHSVNKVSDVISKSCEYKLNSPCILYIMPLVAYELENVIKQNNAELKKKLLFCHKISFMHHFILSTFCIQIDNLIQVPIEVEFTCMHYLCTQDQYEET